MVDPKAAAPASTSVACWLEGLVNVSVLNCVSAILRVGGVGGVGGFGDDGEDPPPQFVSIIKAKRMQLTQRGWLSHRRALCNAEMAASKKMHYSSNIGTWRRSSSNPRLRFRDAPITASTVIDSKAVLGTKIRCVFDRMSGGFTR